MHIVELVRIGDDYYDPETGEYAGPVSMEGYPGAIETEEDFLWVSRKILEAESAYVAQQLELKAVVENVESMLKKRKGRYDWLREKYQAMLEQYAWGQLPRDATGKPKVKTIRNPFLKISFRTSKPKLKVTDMDTAVKFLEEREVTDAIKVEKRVLVSAIPPELVQEIIETVLATWPENTQPPFEYIEGGETASIETGVAN